MRYDGRQDAAASLIALMNSPAATLVLVRHGQARAPDGSYGRETPLSDLGRRQADAVADELAAGATVAALYTSPFPRAVQTASPLSERLGLEPVLDKRLAEFELGNAPLDPSAFGRERPDLLIWHPTHTAVEDGESLRAFSARVGAFCHEVAEKHLGERVAIVAHSGTIEAAIRESRFDPLAEGRAAVDPAYRERSLAVRLGSAMGEPGEGTWVAISRDFIAGGVF